MIHNDPVGMPGFVALALGGLAFLAALLLARRRRVPEPPGSAVRSRRSIVGIAVQMIGIMLAGAGQVRVILPATAPAAVMQGIAVAVLMAGAVALFRGSSVAMGRNWSLVARTRDDHQLVQTGPFAHLRHPIYTGLALFVLAMAIAYGHLSHLWIAGPLYAIGTWLRVAEEERLLRATFGAAYDAYAARVKRFVPGVI